MAKNMRYWRWIFRNSKFKMLSLISLVSFIIWLTEAWYLVYRFLPEENGLLPKNDGSNETLLCKPLLAAARAILDGENIPLPFGTKKKLWKFRSRVPMADLLRNVNVSRLNMDGNANMNIIQPESLAKIRGQKLFITFANKCCWYSKRRAVQKARTVGGFNYTRSFSIDDLSSKFRRRHNGILSVGRGAGYWLWKPYILLNVLLENMREGDLVMYQDAGAYFIQSAYPLLKLAAMSEEGIVLFGLETHMLEKDYTKKDTMVLMAMDIPEVQQSSQRIASYVVLRKTCSSIQFIMEWLAYLSDPRIAADESMLGLPNPKSFIAHRHDQSVLSLLSKKWGLPALRNPSQHGETMVDIHYGPYQQILMHDRNKH